MSQVDEQPSEAVETSTETPPLLSLEELTISFWTRGKWVHAVKGASFSLGRNEGLAVIGESGSGKTLSMMSTLALIPGWPGVVSGALKFQDESTSIDLLEGVKDAYTIENHKVKDTPKAEAFRREYIRRARLLAGQKIGIIFQNPIASLDPLWSVGSTLQESIRLRDPKLSRKEVHEEAIYWLDRVHIKNPKGVMRSYPHQLSGGMCQRVMIASTLAMRPRIIIADEPTTGLDMTTKAQILYLLHEAREQFGSSLIFVTHEIGLAVGLTERVVVMRQGHVVDQFPTMQLSGVRLEGGVLQSSHSFAPHTQQLLAASLKLETDSAASMLARQEGGVELLPDEDMATIVDESLQERLMQGES